MGVREPLALLGQLHRRERPSTVGVEGDASDPAGADGPHGCSDLGDLGRALLAARVVAYEDEDVLTFSRDIAYSRSRAACRASRWSR